MASSKKAAEAEAPVTTLYRVRDGFCLHPVNGSEPLDGGTEVRLTDEEAAFYGHQIELADEDDIAEAEMAEALAAEEAAKLAAAQA